MLKQFLTELFIGLAVLVLIWLFIVAPFSHDANWKGTLGPEIPIMFLLIFAARAWWLYKKGQRK